MSRLLWARYDAPKPASSELCDRARTVQDIGAEALALAERARAAGLTAIAYLLETAAKEAGIEAAAARWPADAGVPDA